MGRSKFRMCSIKNAKRKKAQLRSLVVSVSRHLVNLSVTPSDLTISVVPNIQQLVVLLRTHGLKASIRHHKNPSTPLEAIVCIPRIVRVDWC